MATFKHLLSPTDAGEELKNYPYPHHNSVSCKKDEENLDHIFLTIIFRFIFVHGSVYWI